MTQAEFMGTESAMPSMSTPLPMLADPAAIAAAEGAKARIQAAYVMAMHNPRSFMKSRKRILDACSRPSFASKVEYSKPIGGGKVKGPSIRFAELALREWQNVMVETQTIYEDDEKRRILVRVLDLETNATFSKEIQIGKTVERKDPTGREVIRERPNTQNKTVYVVRATEDELLNKEAALVSKAIRNEGLRLIPQDIIEEALEAAKAAMRGDAKDPLEAIRKLCDYFSASFRVNVDQLEEYLGHPVDECTWEEVDDLRAVANAIKEGEAKWSDYVSPRDKGDKAKSGTATTADNLKERLGKVKEPKPEPEQSASPMIECPKTDSDVSRTGECQKCADRETNCPHWGAVE